MGDRYGLLDVAVGGHCLFLHRCDDFAFGGQDEFVIATQAEDPGASSDDWQRYTAQGGLGAEE